MDYDLRYFEKIDEAEKSGMLNFEIDSCKLSR